jgi:iron complex transport system substrate-binding protein
MVVIAVAACGGQEQTAPNTTSLTSPVTTAQIQTPTTPGPTSAEVSVPVATPATEAASPPTTVQVFPRTVVDADGEVVIPARPKRVIATGSQVDLDSLVVLGIEPVAAGTFFGQPPAWLADAIGDAVLFDVNTVSLEQIAGLDPDLIVGPADELDELAGTLRAIAPTVLLDTRTSWRTNFELIAEATGREEQAEAFLADFDDVVDDTRQLVEPYGDLKVSAFTIGPDGKVLILGDRSSTGEALTLAGLERVEGQDVDAEFVPLSDELISDLDGDVIFVYHSPFLVSQWETFSSSSIWQSIPAVAEGRVVVSTDDRWFFATPQAVRLAVESLVPDVLEPAAGR